MTTKKTLNMRQNTPDIFADLMGSTTRTIEPESNKAAEPASHNTIQESVLIVSESTPSNKAIKQAVKPESNKTIMDIGKEKTTFNLSKKTLDALEDAWIKLRRKLKGEQRITKTLIVERAIEIALDEFDAKSELSDLYIRLQK